jgi:tripartite ATP-independent transporter DctP family solute receptor
MKKWYQLMVILVLGAFVLVSGCGKSEPAKTGVPAAKKVESKRLRFGIAVSENSTWYQGAKKFSEIIKLKTEGKYIVDLYPSDQLAAGNIIKGLESVQVGATDIDMRSVIIYTTLDPRFTVPLMPWLLPSYAEADKALAGPGGKMLFKIATEKGIQPLAFGESGFRQITNSKREILAPADMKGLKIRVPTIKMFINLFKNLGADPTAINFGELFAALQQGTVDGQENPPDVIDSAKIDEVQKYMTIWNASYDPILMSASKKLWASLDDKEKKIFQDAATEAMEYQKKLARQKNDEIVKKFSAKMKITNLSPEQITKFRQAANPVYVEYEKIIGIELLQAFGYKK